MPDEAHPLSAVHNFYLLRDDEDLEVLWSRLTEEAEEKPELTASLELIESGEDLAGYCRTVHKIIGEEIDFCLTLLADVYLVQVMYGSPADGLRERWAHALELIANSRAIIDAEDLTVFGETTMLVAPGEATPDLVETAAELSGARAVLRSDIDPSQAGGGNPALLNLLDAGDRARDMYAIAADDPGVVISTLFPQMDSVIKKLGRSTVYFLEQRSTIEQERLKVDREIGTLLHRQVVSGAAEPEEAGALEKHVGSLSRMFGVLATDSLLVHQQVDQLEKDILALERSTQQLFGERPAVNEIGEHYLDFFGKQLESSRDESLHLDFSRQNAQAAIDVVRTQVELLRAGEEAAIQDQTRQLLSQSLLLQQERMSLQVAAGFVEFILVFYYTIKSWEGVMGLGVVEHISPLVRFGVVAGFAGGAALGTHYLARIFRTRNWKNPMLWFSFSLLVLSFLTMVILSIINY